MKADGTMARVPELAEFSKEHGLKMCSIESIIQYRRRTEKLIRREAQTSLPTRYGDFKLIAYETDVRRVHNTWHWVKGDLSGDEPVLVRVHSECLTGDLFGSYRCDCGGQLHQAMRQIDEEGRGGACVHASGGPGDWSCE